MGYRMRVVGSARVDGGGGLPYHLIYHSIPPPIAPFLQKGILNIYTHLLYTYAVQTHMTQPSSARHCAQQIGSIQ